MGTHTHTHTHTHTQTNKMTTVNPRACVLRVNYRLVVTGITIRPQHLRPRVKGRSCVTAHVILFLSSDLLERGSCRRFLTSTGMASRRGWYGVRDLLPTPTWHRRTRSSVRGGDPGSNYGSGLPGYADGGRSRRPSASSGLHVSERNGSGSRGRGRRQGRGERGGEQLVKYKISTITNWELESLFNCRYSYLPTSMVDSPPTSSSRELREKLMEAPENTLRWEQVRELYKGLFSDGIPSLPPNLPPRLVPLLHFIQVTKEEKVHTFSNGAGKAFLSKLLSLIPAEPWVRISTTNRPQTDWCGVDGPRLFGVVDAAIVKNGHWLVVGEVKGGSRTPLTQIFASMQAVKDRYGEWPYGEILFLFCSSYTKVFYPRRACVRVTVVVLCVCLSVCSRSSCFSIC